MPSDKRLESSKKLAKMLSQGRSDHVSAADLRHNSANIVSRAAGGERLILTRNRKPVAALISMEDFKTLGKSKQR